MEGGTEYVYFLSFIYGFSYHTHFFHKYVLPISMYKLWFLRESHNHLMDRGGTNETVEIVSNYNTVQGTIQTFFRKISELQ